VLNIADQGLQEKLIITPDLKLTKAVLLIKQVENTKEQVRQINDDNKREVDAIQYGNRHRNVYIQKNNGLKPSWHRKLSENQASCLENYWL